MLYPSKLQETDVENWKEFLNVLRVTNLNNVEYQCNNPIVLCRINEKLKLFYKNKDHNNFIIEVSKLLADNEIDLLDKDYFVKISTISGKDILYDEKSDDSIDEGDITTFWINVNSTNKKLIIKTAKQLCNYLFTSERIQAWFEKNNFIVFREWINYKAEEEFRCFIYQRKLVAISQYDYGCDLPDYMKQPDLIVKAISHFINQTIDIIPFDSVVIDLALCIENLNVYFVEFNPFGIESDTDAGLYDYVHDKDILTPDDLINIKTDIRLFDLKYIERKYSV